MPTVSQLQNLVHHLEQAHRIADECAQDYDLETEPIPTIAARSIRARVEGVLYVARELEHMKA